MCQIYQLVVYIIKLFWTKCKFPQNKEIEQQFVLMLETAQKCYFSSKVYSKLLAALKILFLMFQLREKSTEVGLR